MKMLVTIACLFSVVGCSGDNREKRIDPVHAGQQLSMMIEMTESRIKYKVDLLSLKYEIPSSTVGKALLAYLKSYELVFMMLEAKDRGEKLDPVSHLTKRLEIDKLVLISDQHGIPLKTLASIIYDYEIWRGVQEKDQG